MKRGLHFVLKVCWLYLGFVLCVRAAMAEDLGSAVIPPDAIGSEEPSPETYCEERCVEWGTPPPDPFEYCRCKDGFCPAIECPAAPAAPCSKTVRFCGEVVKP